MDDRAKLLVLAKRVERGETGRQLDGDISVAAGLVPEYAFRMLEAKDEVFFATGPQSTWRAPDLTTSIDAQSALPARIATIHWWNVTDRNGTRDECEAVSYGCHKGRALTEPAARLASLLRTIAETK